MEEAAGSSRHKASGLPSLQAPKSNSAKMLGRTGSVLLRNLDIDETSDLSYQDQVRDALSKNAVRVIDLFREWDEDGNGTVSKKEFRKAMPLHRPRWHKWPTERAATITLSYGAGRKV